MARGEIVRHPTAAVIGESGPEAVAPLNSMGQSGFKVEVNFNSPISVGGSGDPRSMFREFAEDIAYQVKRVIETEERRSAVV
jgi:hypothetical protein